MGTMIGTKERPARVAVVGSGPSGFYAAEALLNSGKEVLIDMFDRLPAPYGLVRYGVSPDHPKIKNVITVYERTAADPRVMFLGHVGIGRDVSVEELRLYYDALIFACGAESERSLNIPGEELPGSHTATEFVGWYNGHPDYRNRHFDLSARAVVVIGLGNVAMDVARILCTTVEELRKTDIARHAWEVLAESQIRDVHVIGRRGPAQAVFTPAEIREFSHLTDCDLIVDKRYLELNYASQHELNDPNNAIRQKNFTILQEFAAREPAGKRRRIIFHFLKSPVAIMGGRQVERIMLERNQLTGPIGAQIAEGTKEFEELDCGLVFRSVGYRGVPIQGVPFDPQRGIFINRGGRILKEGQPISGFYAVGWIKRGPSGVIGTNKPDSQATVAAFLEDLPSLSGCPNPRREDVRHFLAERKIRFIEFSDWKKIDSLEIARGQKEGKPREKIVTVEEMLSIAGK